MAETNPGAAPVETLPAPEKDSSRFIESPGLLIRLKKGGQALNPTETNLPQVTIDELASPGFNPEVDQKLSTKITEECNTYWEGQADASVQWKQDFVSQITLCKDSLATDPLAQREAQVLAKFGINVQSFNENAAQQFLDKFCVHQYDTKNWKNFVTTAVNGYASYEQLMEDIDIIKGLANIYGYDMAEVVVHAIIDQKKHTTDPGRIDTMLKANETDDSGVALQNRLNEKDTHSLNILNGQEQFTIKKDNDPHTARRRQAATATSRPTTNPTTNPAAAARPEATPPPPDNSPVRNPGEKLPDGSYLLPALFGKIEGEVDNNHPYFVENPPLLDNPKLLSDAELMRLTSTEPFIILSSQDPSRTTFNTAVIPWDTSLFDQERYEDAIEAEDTAGLISLCAASAETPEKQAALYKSLAQNIINLHDKMPDFLSEWLIRQAQNEFTLESNGKPVLVDSLSQLIGPDRLQTNRMLPDFEDISKLPDATMALWKPRIGHLQQVFSDPHPQLQPHELEWINFLSRSVNVGEMVEILKGKPTVQTERQPVGNVDLRKRFGVVVGEPDRNQPYFIEHVPDEVPDIVKRMNLDITEPMFLFGPNVNGKLNDRVAKFAWDLDTNPRFKNGELTTDNDSGIFGLAAASAENPAEQAKLYKLLAETILLVHGKNKNLLNDWLDQQGDQATTVDELSKPKSTLALFQVYDWNRMNAQNASREQRINDQLLPWVQNPDAPIGFSIDSDLTQTIWEPRIQQLRTLFQQPNPQLEPHHIRWIEFLGHSVQVDTVMQLLKNPSARP